MIFDKLDRHPRYFGLHKGLSAGFTYLSTHDFTAVEPGRIDLNGDALYAVVQMYTTRPVGEGIWESHRRYIDLQYLVSGRERFLFAPLEQMQTGIYVPEKDFLPLTGSGSTLDLTSGFFVVFFPEDAHMPGLQLDMPELVKKVVIKIKILGI